MLLLQVAHLGPSTAMHSYKPSVTAASLVTDRQTDAQNDYRNPAVHAPRVNYGNVLERSSYIQKNDDVFIPFHPIQTVSHRLC